MTKHTILRSRRDSGGFTLIELLIVISVIAILAVMAIPSFLTSRLTANESNAITSLRFLMTGQELFSLRKAVDIDADGLGEYGTFGELAGGTTLDRGGAAPAVKLDPPIMQAPFEQIDANGYAQKTGFQFLLFLPDAGDQGVPEVGGGGGDPAVDPDLSETRWSCYAWPVDPSSSGNRAFFVDYRGQILSTRMDATEYDKNNPPRFDAALVAPSMGSGLATGAVGTDGNTWTTL